jgi:hypothetical protein
MKKLLAIAFALACTMALARNAKAAGGTEFGVDDDLTVMGTDGNWGDADLQVNGFSKFGVTVNTQRITEDTRGSVAIAGGLQVDGTIYGSSMTLSNQLYVAPAAVSLMPVDQNTRILVQDSDGLFRYQILKNVVSGGTTGGVDDLNLPVWDSFQGKYVNSAIIQSDFAFGVGKLLTMKDDVLMNQTLHVVKAVTLDDTLTVKGDTNIGLAADPKNVAINSDLDTNAALKVQAKADGGTGYAARFYTRAGDEIAFMRAKH